MPNGAVGDMFKIKSKGLQRLAWLLGVLGALGGLSCGLMLMNDSHSFFNQHYDWTRYGVIIFVIVMGCIGFAAPFCLVRDVAWVLEGFSEDKQTSDRIS